MTAAADGRRAGYAKGRAKRQEIIETAMVVFGESGYNKSSMLEIAERCSLSRAGLAHHFPSKESILEAVLAWRDQADRDRFRSNGSADGSGLGILRGMVDLARHNSTVPGLIALYSVLAAEASTPSHPAHDYFVKRYDRIVRGTQRALERVQAAGYLRDDADPEALGIELTALMDGLQIQWLLNAERIDMAARLRAAIQRFLVVDL
ncbi:TetR/AcrR family transcriptional regulator [Propionicicella superfundia]|uniref:TetR/AcrR family transcriptional regulator n=1 Tax=Propionicicella superfundia TaxID=348582 RepID=UPI00040DBACD|nr:TetR/AcrR family transcriptional regulator [Propionicicella superfundia]